LSYTNKCNLTQEIIRAISASNRYIRKKRNSKFQNDLQTKDKSEEYFQDETCKFFKINSTLWAWTNAGKVKAYGIGASATTKEMS
jgi:threonyl-tRNA synthetase